MVIALVLGLAAAGTGALLVLSQQGQYVSRATLFIDQPALIARSESGSIIQKLSQLRFKYAGLAQTSVIARPVAQRLKLSEGVVLREVSAVVDPRSLLLRVVAQSSRASRASQLAGAVAEELVRYVTAEQEAPNIPAERRVTMTIVTQASAAGKVSPTRARAIAVATASGLLVVGAAYVALRLRAPPTETEE